MKVLISTLGYRSEPVKALFTQKGANKLILVPGKPAWKVLPEEEVTEEVLKDKDKHNPIKVAERVKSDLEKLGLKVEIAPVNAFDFDECLKTIIDILKKESGNEIIVGVGPGTFLISAAALCACWIIGVKAFYVQERRDKIEKIGEVPVPAPGYFKDLGEKKKRILLALSEGEKRITDIAEEANIGGWEKDKNGKEHRRLNTASYHLKELEEWRLVESEMETEKDRREKKWRLTNFGKIKLYV